ncbi:hypothetical protein AAHC03_01730 [Spirometra sp. Aus1]
MLLTEIMTRRSVLSEDPQTFNSCPRDQGAFWSDLFSRAFQEYDQLSTFNFSSHDDLLFFVNQTVRKEGKPQLQVFRRGSPNLPGLADPRIHWENTVYLNLILQCFVYVLTVGVCTRSGAKEIEILRKCSHVVYASPSSRQMESKGTEERIVYPHVVFHVDNFEEVFSDCVLRDSECLCMEVTAYNRLGVLQGVLFEAVIRYSALKTAHDLQINSEPLTHRRSGSNSNLQVLGRRPRPPDKILDSSGGSQPRTFLRILAARSEAFAEVAVHFVSSAEPPSLGFSSARPGIAIPVTAVGLTTRNSHPHVGTENASLHSRRWTADCQSQCPPPRRRPTGRTASAEPDKHRSSSVTNSPMHSALEDRTEVRKKARVFLSRSTSSEQSPERLRDNNAVAAPTSRVGKLISGLAGFTTSPSRRARSYTTRPRGRGGGGLSQLGRKTRSAGGELDHLSERFGCVTKTCRDVEATTFEDEFDDMPTDTDQIASRSESFGQAWQWFKERRRITSIELNAAVTYVSLPWSLIISSIFDSKRVPVLTSHFIGTQKEPA